MKKVIIKSKHYKNKIKSASIVWWNQIFILVVQTFLSEFCFLSSPFRNNARFLLIFDINALLMKSISELFVFHYWGWHDDFTTIPQIVMPMPCQYVKQCKNFSLVFLWKIKLAANQTILMSQSNRAPNSNVSTFQ